MNLQNAMTAALSLYLAWLAYVSFIAKVPPADDCDNGWP